MTALDQSKPMADTRPKSPFDLPELRKIIKAYLTKTDAVACSRVCRTWSVYFLDLVWNTIDFSKFNQAQLTSGAIVKHGHHIRTVKHLQSSSQIELLMWNHQRHNLSNLSVTVSAELAYQTDLYDFLRLVRGTLTELDLGVELPKTVTPVGNPPRLTNTAAKINVPVDVILPRGPSQLTKITLRGLQLTRLSLIELLQGCPDLLDLSLYNVDVPSRSLFNNWSFNHPTLRYLSAPFDAVIATSSEQGFSVKPTLLGLFPGLERWTVWVNNALEHSALTQQSNFVKMLCPKLKEIQLPVESAAAAKELVARVFVQIETLAFMQQALSSEFVIAILGHSKTLKHIQCVPPEGTLLYDSTKLPQVIHHYRSSFWTLQSIPRLCSQLESFCLPLCEIDMDDIDKGDWECKGLKELRIRIAGLDTAEKIERAIALWLDGRRFHQRNERMGHLTFPTAEYLRIGRCLESRVAAHLIKLKELRTVWLGTKVWRV